MAAITIPGENLIAKKQADGELLTIDQFILANIPDVNPDDPVNRNEQRPPANQIVLEEQVSQVGYINPNMVVYSLMLDTGGNKFDFNWIGLYSSADDVVVAITYLPTQTKDPTVAMTRNFMLQFSGAAETTDINIDAESWQVDFSARMDGTDERVRQLSEDTIGRQLFYGDACKVTQGDNDYYKVAAGEGHVVGIRFNYVEKSVLVTKFPSSIWMDVCQKTNSMSDIEPEAVAVVSQTDRSDYEDQDGVKHYLERVSVVESDGRVIDYRRMNTEVSVLIPDFHLPLVSDIHLREGFGTNEFSRASAKWYINKLGVLTKAEVDEPAFEKEGILIEGSSTNLLIYSEDLTKTRKASSRININPIRSGEPYPLSNEIGWADKSGSAYCRFGIGDIPAEGIVTASIFIKPQQGTHVWLGVVARDGSEYKLYRRLVDLDTGDSDFSSNKLANGLYRVSVTWDCGTGDASNNNSSGLEVAFIEEGGSENTLIYVGGWQVEKRPLCTSYIPTEGSITTRNSDSLEVQPSNIVKHPYTITCVVSGLNTGTISGITRGVWNAHGQAKNVMRMDASEASSLNHYVSSGGFLYYTGKGAVPENVRLAAVYEGVGRPLKGFGNAIKLREHASVTPTDDTTTATVFCIGRASLNTSGTLYGHIRDFKIWYRALTDEQISALGSA